MAELTDTSALSCAIFGVIVSTLLPCDERLADETVSHLYNASRIPSRWSSNTPSEEENLVQGLAAMVSVCVQHMYGHLGYMLEL
jgi:hypothetical protein